MVGGFFYCFGFDGDMYSGCGGCLFFVFFNFGGGDDGLGNVVCVWVGVRCIGR